MVQILTETLGVSRNDAMSAAGCLEGAGFTRPRRGLMWQEVGTVSIAVATATFTVMYDESKGGIPYPYVLLVNGALKEVFGSRKRAKDYAQILDKEARYA